MTKKAPSKATPKKITPAPTVPQKAKPWRVEKADSPEKYGDLQTPVADGWLRVAPPPAVATPPITKEVPTKTERPERDFMLESAMESICPKLEDDAPDWAKRARQMFLVSLKPGNRRSKGSDFYKMGFETGWNHGLGKLLLDGVDEKLRNMVARALEESKDTLKVKIATGASEEMAADFFAGLRDAVEHVRDMRNRAKAVQTVRAYQTIAADWREASKCEGNAGTLHQWLIDKGAIHFRTDPAATRNICRIIGFPTRGKAGSPRQEKQ